MLETLAHIALFVVLLSVVTFIAADTFTHLLGGLTVEYIIIAALCALPCWLLYHEWNRG